MARASRHSPTLGWGTTPPATHLDRRRGRPCAQPVLCTKSATTRPQPVATDTRDGSPQEPPREATRLRRSMRVGMLTGGGDCPGLNPVIRAVCRRLWESGHETFGVL